MVVESLLINPPSCRGLSLVGLVARGERGGWILIDFLYCFIELKWYIRVLLNHVCFINFVLCLPETKYAGDDSVYIGVGRHIYLKADLIIR